MTHSSGVSLGLSAGYGSDFLCYSITNVVFPNDVFLQHPFVTQLLTRNLIIELLDMANNPELHSTHTHSMDDMELEVSDAAS